jgi:GTPase SAR1 family protein
MFVGIQAIGKTSLLNKLREETTGLSRGRSNSSSGNERLSTVGIDINEWIFEKPKNTRLQSSNPSSFLQNQQFIDQNNLKNFGPVCFRTWDFAGQREYYATHQYFISKRALYLVCWKLTEQEKVCFLFCC